ncbi:MAG TPA: acyl-ACP--UDP-N-acetylglucosamine O-acyltransferase [Bacteroidia bacterium]|jgi:UDP-N-acetylglucosamine acyltransferase|nr:acyl-ACP--UDP-N-acetylglucosamine O-acyltransferase [Bacteroidia bacterium]
MISPLAHVHKGAKIADSAVVEPFAVIHDNVVIGEGTIIDSHAIIMSGARIGKNCRIFPGAVISSIPQDLKFVGEDTTVEIGDNTVIREYATINRGTKANWKTVIGKNCLIMCYVHMGHDCVIGDNVILAGYCGLAGHVIIEDYAILEGYSAVQPFIKIGAHVFCAGDSKVRKNIPPYVKCAREPLSYIGVNSVGLTRRGFSAETIKQIEDTYRLLYVKGTSIATALQHIESEIPDSKEKRHIVDFVKESVNGIMKGPVRSVKETAPVEK